MPSGFHSSKRIVKGIDTNFPLKDGDRIEVEIKGKTLIIKKSKRVKRFWKQRLLVLGGVSFVSGLEWRRSLGFLIGLSVRTAFLRVAVTAGTNAYTTSGANIN